MATLLTARSLVTELKICANQNDLERGKLLHSAATKAGLLTNVYVSNTLILMYIRCRDVQQARRIFDVMKPRDVVSWNVIILGYVEHGEHLQALEVFERIDCAPNRATFLAVLKACTALARIDKKTALQKGTVAHQLSRRFGLDRDAAVSSALVKMYSVSGEMQQAEYVFENVKDRDAVLWNVLILGYVEQRLIKEALKALRRMDLAPNRGTFLAALKACACLKPEIEGQAQLHHLHEKAREFGFDRDVLVASSLMDVYGRYGDTTQARDIFDQLTVRDVGVWNVLIQGYVLNGEYELALEAFTRIDCQPNHITFVAGLKACAGLGCLENGKTLHSQARGLGLDVAPIVANTLMNMYSKCGAMSQARDTFDQMKRKDVVSWTSLINGYVENGESHMALEAFERMDCLPNGFTLAAAIKACSSLAVSQPSEESTWLQKGKSLHQTARELGFDTDVVLSSALVYMYGKAGEMTQAKEVFDRMEHRTVITWNALLLGYVENGEFQTAVDMFKRINCEGDPLTFVAVLKASGSLGAADVGRRIYAQVCRLGWEDVEMVSTGLVDFYVKSGNMDAAEHVFGSLHSGNNTWSWSALIGGYSSVGNTSKVFELVKRMAESGVQMNGVTLQLVLAACSHAGLVEEGRRWFESMESKFGVVPGVEHYTCMVDMLGRANKLDIAVSMVKDMPVRGDAVLWKALLAKFRNVEGGEVVLKSLMAPCLPESNHGCGHEDDQKR